MSAIISGRLVKYAQSLPFTLSKGIGKGAPKREPLTPAVTGRMRDDRGPEHQHGTAIDFDLGQGAK
jgi:hypothetical protein